jgi:hypothetical protein
MIDLLRILSDDEASRTHAVIRMDNDWREPAFDKWGILLTRRGAVTDNFRDPGQLLIREKSIPSPTARAKSHKRANLYADDNNLRFFDNIENGRSLSRDRNNRETKDSEPKPRQRSRSNHRKSMPIIDPEIYKSEIAKRTLVPDYYLQHSAQAAISLKGTPATKAQMSGDTDVSRMPVGAPKAGGRKQCAYYSKGNCRLGEACKFEHLDGPCLERVTNSNDQK